MALNSQKTTPIFLLILAGLVGYMGYTGAGISTVGLDGLAAGKAKVAAIRDTISTLRSQTDSAKRELATGTVEDLNKRLDGYRASLSMLRRLVPERSEVPNLLDDMSTRARIRGVTLSRADPVLRLSPVRRRSRPSASTSRSSATTTRSARSWPTSPACSASSSRWT
jgi:Tfp pilus assembly protein PilO